MAAVDALLRDEVLGIGKEDSRQMDDLWNDLVAADAAKAYRAIGALSQRPDTTIGLLRKTLRPADGESPSADQIDELIKQLGASNLDTRRTASAKLRRIGAAANTRMTEYLATKKDDIPPVVSSRIELLVAAAPAKPSNDDLRTRRAIHALELIGTADAQRILAQLAGGSPSAHPTIDARQSLERLKRE